MGAKTTNNALYFSSDVGVRIYALICILFLKKLLDRCVCFLNSFILFIIHQSGRGKSLNDFAMHWKAYIQIIIIQKFHAYFNYRIIQVGTTVVFLSCLWVDYATMGYAYVDNNIYTVWVCHKKCNFGHVFENSSGVQSIEAEMLCLPKNNIYFFYLL